MQFLRKNDIALAYEDTNTALPPLVLVHGCGLDHGSLTNQTVFFSRSHRVISVDLRGHGESDAPANAGAPVLRKALELALVDRREVEFAAQPRKNILRAQRPRKSTST